MLLVLTAATLAGGLLLAQDATREDRWAQAMWAASQLQKQGAHSEAAATMTAALEAAKAFGPEDPRLAATLHYLGTICHALGRYTESERHYRRALAIWEKDRGAHLVWLIATVNNLAALCIETGRHGMAARLLKGRLMDREKLGAESEESVNFLNNLGFVYNAERRYREAEAAFREALAICEKNPGHDCPLGELLSSLGGVCVKTKRHGEAEEYLRRSLAIHHRALGEDHQKTIRPLMNLSTLYGEMERWSEAEGCLRQALALARKSLGPEHPLTGAILSDYAFLLRRLSRKAEAKEAQKQARRIQEKVARENPGSHTVDLSELLRSHGRR